MHEEASSHFESMIDLTALGHRFLQREFNFLPTVGWQFDPFGHSTTTNAALLSAQIAKGVIIIYLLKAISNIYIPLIL